MQDMKRIARLRLAGLLALLAAASPLGALTVTVRPVLHWAAENGLTTIFAALEGKVADVQALHATVLLRSAEISAQQQKLDEAERDAARELTNLRTEIRASTDRFELENRSLDAASERIAELRVGTPDGWRRSPETHAQTRMVEEWKG